MIDRESRTVRGLGAALLLQCGAAGSDRELPQTICLRDASRREAIAQPEAASLEASGP